MRHHFVTNGAVTQTEKEVNDNHPTYKLTINKLGSTRIIQKPKPSVYKYQYMGNLESDRPISYDSKSFYASRLFGVYIFGNEALSRLWRTIIEDCLNHIQVFKENALLKDYILDLSKRAINYKAEGLTVLLFSDGSHLVIPDVTSGFRFDYSIRTDSNTEIIVED